MEKLRDASNLDTIVQFILKFCVDAWTVHDYCTGGSDCLEYVADMVEDSVHLYALLDEVGVDCGDSCEVFGEELSRRLRVLAERKKFDGEFELFDEFSKVLSDLQQVVDDVDTVFDAVSQELYRIYVECDGAEIRERIEDLMNRLRKNVGEAGSRHTASH
jgi:hypothetical protein